MERNKIIETDKSDKSSLCGVRKRSIVESLIDLSYPSSIRREIFCHPLGNSPLMNRFVTYEFSIHHFLKFIEPLSLFQSIFFCGLVVFLITEQSLYLLKNCTSLSKLLSFYIIQAFYYSYSC